MDSIDYSLLPVHLHDEMKAYINHQQPGDFLLAVLSNDLKEACARADNVNRYRLWDIVHFLHNHAPMECWGSYERVQAWLKGDMK